jgi:hypothetical protein
MTGQSSAKTKPGGASGYSHTRTSRSGLYSLLKLRRRGGLFAMGWNEGYRIMESQIIAIYDLGLLKKDLLNALMEPFKGTDIDSGGSEDLRAKDGKDVEEIVCFIMEPEKWKEAVDSWSPDPEYPDDPYNEKLAELWREITRREWKFW